MQPKCSSPALTPESSRLSTDEKVVLFRRLFRGRKDVYPIRWESKTTVPLSDAVLYDDLAGGHTMNAISLRLPDASLCVLRESLRVNAEFSRAEHVPD